MMIPGMFGDCKKKTTKYLETSIRYTNKRSADTVSSAATRRVFVNKY